MAKINVVFDTNVWISAVLFNGTPKKAIDLALEKCQIFCSAAILQELREVLIDDFGLPSEKLEEVTEVILNMVRIVPIMGNLKNISLDQKDNPIIETALASGADYLVSGDKHLLILEKFQNIKIITPSQFISIAY